MTQEAYQEIIRAIGNLEGKIDGINRRLDITNGRIAKSEDNIANLKTSEAVSNNKFNFIGAIGSLFGGLAGATLLRILIK